MFGCLNILTTNEVGRGKCSLHASDELAKKNCDQPRIR